MKNRLSNKLNSAAGFTLVELMVVLVILGILATFTVPALTGYIDNAHTKQAVSEAQSCVMAATTLATKARNADTSEGKTTFTTWAGGRFYTPDENPTVADPLVLTEGGGQYFANGNAAAAAAPASALSLLSSGAAGAMADVPAQADVPGELKALRFTSAGQVIYLQYQTGKVLVTYTNDGQSSIKVEPIATPDVPTPVVNTPTPSPSPSSSPNPSASPTPSSTPTPTPNPNLIEVYVVDTAGNLLSNVPMKITGKIVEEDDGNWNTSDAQGNPHPVTLLTHNNRKITIEFNEKGAGYNDITKENGFITNSKLVANVDKTTGAITIKNDDTRPAYPAYKHYVVGNRIYFVCKETTVQLEFRYQGNDNPFPEDKTLTGYTAAFLSSQYSGDALQPYLYRPDSHQFTAPATFEDLFRAVQLYNDGKLLTYGTDFTAVSTPTYTPGTPGTYKITVTTKLYGTTTLNAKVYAYIEGPKLTTTRGGSVNFKNYALPWEFYKIRYDDAKGDAEDGISYGKLSPGNLICDNGDYYLVYSEITTAYGDLASAMAAMPDKIMKLSTTNVIIKDTDYLDENNKWKQALPAGTLGYWDGKLYLLKEAVGTGAEFDQSKWVEIPDWCYEASVPVAVTINLKDSLSADYINTRYDDLSAIALSYTAPVKDWSTLQSVSFQLTGTDSQGNALTIYDKNGLVEGGSFDISSGGAKELYLVPGSYRLVQTAITGKADSDDFHASDWYACAGDITHQRDAALKACNMEDPYGESGSPSLPFTVTTSQAAEEKTLIYRPFLKVETTLSTKTPASVTLDFTRRVDGYKSDDTYKYDAGTTIVQGITVANSCRIELLPRNSSDGATGTTGEKYGQLISIRWDVFTNTLAPDDRTNGYDRSKLYLSTSNTAVRQLFNFSIKVKNVPGSIVRDDYILGANYETDATDDYFKVFWNAGTLQLRTSSYNRAKTNLNDFTARPGNTLKLAITYIHEDYDARILAEEITTALDKITTLAPSLGLTSSSYNVNSSYRNKDSAAKTFWDAFKAALPKTDGYELDTSAWCLCRTDWQSNEWHLAYVNTTATSGTYNMYLFRKNPNGNGLQVKTFVDRASLRAENGLNRIALGNGDYTNCINSTTVDWVNLDLENFYPNQHG